MDIDEIFNNIGAFGLAQKKIFYLLNTIHIFIGLHTLAPSFIGIDPGWTCNEYPSINNQSFLCKQYDLGKCTPKFSSEYTSIVTEWELICSRSSLPNLSQSAYFFGFLLGAYVWGSVADKIGRRKTFWLGLFLVVTSCLCYGLAPYYMIFVLFRLACAFSLAGVILSSFSLTVEIVGISARSYAGIVGSGLFAIAYPMIATLAYFIRSWRTLAVFNSLLGVLFFLLWRIIPESPRWLLVNGYEQEARLVLAKIAEGNGATMPSVKLKKPMMSQSGKPVSMKDLLKGKRIRQRTVTLFVVWFTNSMVYYVLAMSAGKLGGNMYVSFSLSGLVEMPSLVLAYILIDKVGRRWSHGGFLVISGISCLVWNFISWISVGDSSKMVVALIGKFAVAGSFSIIYLYTAELFPTQVRNIGAGLSSIGGRIGGILAPIVLLLGQYSTGLPMLLVGGLAAIVGALSLTLPETLNQSMLETLQELETH